MTDHPSFRAGKNINEPAGKHYVSMFIRNRTIWLEFHKGPDLGFHSPGLVREIANHLLVLADELENIENNE